jgi:hypothetical protein
MNTLLFCEVTMGACVAILMLMLTPISNPFFVFLTTFGILLAIIVISTLSTLINFETTSEVPNGSNLATIRVCPDYYGYATGEKNVIICNSSNLLYDPTTDTSTEYKLLSMFDGTDHVVPPRINLSGMFTKVSDALICKIVSGKSPAGTKDSNDVDIPTGMQYVPWTSVRPYCAGVGPYL